MQQRLRVNRVAPRRGQVKFDAEIVSGNTERRRSKGRRVDALALVVQALPIDFGVVLPCPQADVAELPRPDAAADEVLVGVQEQVQQVLVRRHGEKAVHLDGIEVGKEVVQLVMCIFGRIEQVAVQLDVERAALFCVGHLVRCGQFVSGCVGAQAVCEKLLVADHELAVRNQKIVVRADAVVGLRIQAAAKLALDHDRVQSRRAELAIEFCKLRRPHGLVQHLPDDLLFGHSEQRRVFRSGGRFAGGLEDDRQQLLLPRQLENGRPVHVFGGERPAGNGSLGDMKKMFFGDGQGHVCVPSPFFVFFDGVSDKQRCSAEKRAHRVADHVVRFRKPQRAAVLGELDSRAERAADERCEGDFAPTVPLSRQGIRER